MVAQCTCCLHSQRSLLSRRSINYATIFQTPRNFKWLMLRDEQCVKWHPDLKIHNQSTKMKEKSAHMLTLFFSRIAALLFHIVQTVDPSSIPQFQRPSNNSLLIHFSQILPYVPLFHVLHRIFLLHTTFEICQETSIVKQYHLILYYQYLTPMVTYSIISTLTKFISQPSRICFGTLWKISMFQVGGHPKKLNAVEIKILYPILTFEMCQKRRAFKPNENESIRKLFW